MQIKLFTVPVLGGEALAEELNVFLRSKKILQVEQHLAQDPGGALWCFCIRYTEDYSPLNKNKERVDYKQVLDAASFERFARMREIRKEVAIKDAVPPFAVFTDEELAGLAKLETLTEATMKQVKGIGEKKLEKYGQYFLTKPADAQSQPPA